MLSRDWKPGHLDACWRQRTGCDVTRSSAGSWGERSSSGSEVLVIQRTWVWLLLGTAYGLYKSSKESRIHAFFKRHFSALAKRWETNKNERPKGNTCLSENLTGKCSCLQLCSYASHLLTFVFCAYDNISVGSFAKTCKRTYNNGVLGIFHKSCQCKP